MKTAMPEKHKFQVEFYSDSQIERITYNNNAIDNRIGNSSIDILNTVKEFWQSQKEKRLIDLDISERPIFRLSPFWEWIHNLDVLVSLQQKNNAISEMVKSKQKQIYLINLMNSVPSKSISFKTGIMDENSEVGVCYSCETIFDFINATLDYISSNGTSINICSNCGRLFIPESKSNEKYCHNVSPQYPNKDCQSAARLIKQKQRESENLCTNLRKAIYNRLYQRAEKAATDKLYNQYQKMIFEFQETASQYKDNIKAGIIDREDYLQWLQEYQAQLNQKKSTL